MKVAISLGLILILALPASAAADRYRPRRAGHPLRIAAYVLHPVGYVLDRLIFYPMWRLGQQPLVAEVFGVQVIADAEPEASACERTWGLSDVPSPACALGEAGSTEERIQCFLDEWMRSVASLDYERYRLLGLQLPREHFERSYGWPACAELGLELLYHDEPEPGQLKVLLRMIYTYRDGFSTRRTEREHRIVLRETEEGLRYAGTW